MKIYRGQHREPGCLYAAALTVVLLAVAILIAL